MKTLAFLSLCLSTLAFAEPLRGQDLQIETQIRPEQIVIGERNPVLEISVQNRFQGSGTERWPQIQSVEEPRAEGLELIQLSTSSSSRVTVINGRQTAVLARVVRFQIRVLEGPGRYEIPPIRLRVDGQQVQTEPLTFEVFPRDRGDDLSLDQRYFIEFDPGEGPFYAGQHIMAELRFLRHSRSPAPDFGGLEAIGEGPKLDFHNIEKVDRVFRDGFNYEQISFPISLQPDKGGTFSRGYRMLVGIPLEMPGRSSRRFLTRPLQRQYLTDVAEFEVLPLPVDGRPDSFTGAIGQFDLSADLPPRQTEVGAPLRIRLRLEGRGNLDRISPPQIEHPDWDVFFQDSRVNSVHDIGYEGSRVFEYTAFARREGEIIFPAIEVATFDPEAGRYRTLRTLPARYQVAPASNPFVARENSPLAPFESPPISPSKRTYEPELWRQAGFWTLTAAPFGIWLGLLGFMRFAGQAGVQKRWRQMRYRALATRELRAANREAQTKHARGFYQHAAACLAWSVSARLDRDCRSLAPRELTDLLEGVLDDASLQAIRRFLGKADSRFAPEEAGPSGEEVALLRQLQRKL